MPFNGCGRGWGTDYSFRGDLHDLCAIPLLFCVSFQNLVNLVSCIWVLFEEEPSKVPMKHWAGYWVFLISCILAVLGRDSPNSWVQAELFHQKSRITTCCVLVLEELCRLSIRRSTMQLLRQIPPKPSLQPVNSFVQLREHCSSKSGSHTLQRTHSSRWQVLVCSLLLKKRLKLASDSYSN